MRSLLANRPLLAALLCSLLLVLRVGEAHLHMCFDGKEKPAELHLVDVGIEHAVEPGAEHQDKNISMSVGEIAKLSTFDLDLPAALLLVVLVLLSAVYAPVVILRDRTARVADAVFWLRPPLRGPPLTARA